MRRELDEVTAGSKLPDCVSDALFDALLGITVRRPGYVKRAWVEERTAGRDLGRLVGGAGSGLGVAAPTDPYPWLPAALRETP